MISDGREPIQPRWIITTKFGTRESCAGIMKAARSTTNNARRNGKLYFAKASAASESMMCDGSPSSHLVDPHRSSASQLEQRRGVGEVDDRRDLLFGDRHGRGRIDVLARSKRQEYESPVGPALGEDRDGVRIGGQHLVEVGTGAVQLLGPSAPLRDPERGPHEHPFWGSRFHSCRNKSIRVVKTAAF